MKDATQIENSREPYIDFMRSFGLLLLVIAHTNPADWILQLRCFDVPLMVVVSAMCYKSLRGGVFTILHKKAQKDLSACGSVFDNVLRCIVCLCSIGRFSQLDSLPNMRKLPVAQLAEHRLCLDNAGVPAHGLDYAVA